MRTTVLCVLSLLLLAGCGREPVTGRAGMDATSDGAARIAQTSAAAMRTRDRVAASLPDRGTLVAYPAVPVRPAGAYTWHRATIDEGHAFAAMRSGRVLRLRAPDGTPVEAVFDRHVEHASGDWTWVGHAPGHPEQQTILTFGRDAVFGSIAQGDRPALRVTMRDGLSWVVDTDPSTVPGLPSSAPRRDFLQVPTGALARLASANRQRDAARSGPAPSTSAQGTQAASANAGVIDLLIGYSQGFAAANGGPSAALTHLNYLVDVNNVAYDNSGIDARMRLVGAMQVNYADATSNDSALEALSAYSVATQGPVPPDAAFEPLRAAREQTGADLVTFVRDFQTPEQAGCGIAWLLGGGLFGIRAGDGQDALGYSVISSGYDVDESDGKNYYCRDETLAHEIGHNMGAAHDQETAKGADGVLDNPDDYGAFTYSFAYKATTSTGNFYTIMAYGDSGQSQFRIFSNPSSTFCGGRACGTSETDNARTLRQTIPTVAGFRASVVPTARPVAYDFNGDRVSDLLWRNARIGADTIWLGANAATQQPVVGVDNLDWHMLGSGDFNADGKADILWRNLRTGVNTIWRSGNAADSQAVALVANLDWEIVGVGDFDQNGTADIAWRNRSTGANTIWRDANASTQTRLVTITDADWRIVGVGDFDGDGSSDLLWRNRRTGSNSIWKGGDFYNRQTVAKVGNLEWSIVGTGDFDGDGIDDVLWRNARTGANVIWRSADYTAVSAVIRISNLDWHIEAVGDFTGDGSADIAWRNAATGQNVVWPSAQYAQQVTLASYTDLAWRIEPETGP